MGFNPAQVKIDYLAECALRLRLVASKWPSAIALNFSSTINEASRPARGSPDPNLANRNAMTCGASIDMRRPEAVRSNIEAYPVLSSLASSPPRCPRDEASSSAVRAVEDGWEVGPAEAQIEQLAWGVGV
jgi:hypothetical protein